MEPIQNTSLFQSNIDANSSYALRGAATWAKVVGIVSILMALAFFTFAYVIQNGRSAFETGFQEGYRQNGPTYGNNYMFGVITCAACGIILLISAAFAIGFSNKISRSVRGNDNTALAGGFASLRNYFAFWGIIIILTLLLFVIGIAGIIIAANGRNY